jgi:hypothetical protein
LVAFINSNRDAPHFSRDRWKKIMQAYGKVVDSKQAGRGTEALALGAVDPVVEAQSFHLGSCCAFAYHDASVTGGFRFYLGRIERMIYKSGNVTKRLYQRIAMNEFPKDSLYFYCAWFEPLLVPDDRRPDAVLEATRYKYGPPQDNRHYIEAKYMINVVTLEYVGDEVFVMSQADLDIARNYIQIFARRVAEEAVTSAVAAEDAVVGETGVRSTKKTTGVGSSNSNKRSKNKR